jgi:hypothetical protein
VVGCQYLGTIHGTGLRGSWFGEGILHSLWRCGFVPVICCRTWYMRINICSTSSTANPKRNRRLHGRGRIFQICGHLPDIQPDNFEDYSCVAKLDSDRSMLISIQC